MIRNHEQSCHGLNPSARGRHFVSACRIPNKPREVKLRSLLYISTPPSLKFLSEASFGSLQNVVKTNAVCPVTNVLSFFGPGQPIKAFEARRIVRDRLALREITVRCAGSTRWQRQQRRRTTSWCERFDRGSVLRCLAGVWAGHLCGAVYRRRIAAYLANVGPADAFTVRTAVTGSAALAASRRRLRRRQRQRRDQSEQGRKATDCRLHGLRLAVSPDPVQLATAARLLSATRAPLVDRK